MVIRIILRNEELCDIGLNVISSARFEGNSAKYYAYNKDTRNSTSTLVGDDNVGIVAYKYDEFGTTQVIGNQNIENEVCYTGQVYDKETGDYYYNARYYSPDEGRFLTADTYRGEFEEPLSLHLYAYCVNNPVNYTDPSGHKRLKVGVNNFSSTLSHSSKYDRLYWTVKCSKKNWHFVFTGWITVSLRSYYRYFPCRGVGSGRLRAAGTKTVRPNKTGRYTARLGGNGVVT